MNKKYICIKNYEYGKVVINKNQNIELVGYVLDGKIPCIATEDGAVFSITGDFKEHFKELTKIKWKTQKQYLDSSFMCPRCESTDIEADTMLVGDNNDAEQGISCLSCGAEWTDVYELKRYEAKT